ncbi:MAG: hypothetical protein K2M85_09255 [Paramuribaculum sp.]|nr:hypothetical protein [Paramuribaculum sp.]
MLIFSSSTLRTLSLLALLVGIDYVCVLAALLADLRSGVLKARRTDTPRTSRGLRRTVEKAARYYVTLFAMSVIDALALASAFYLRAVVGWEFPPFPLFTTLGAAGLCGIELKSVYENSREKGDYDTVARTLRRMLTDADFRSRLLDMLR